MWVVIKIVKKRKWSLASITKQITRRESSMLIVK